MALASGLLPTILETAALTSLASSKKAVFASGVTMAKRPKANKEPKTPTFLTMFMQLSKNKCPG